VTRSSGIAVPLLIACALCGCFATGYRLPPPPAAETRASPTTVIYVIGQLSGRVSGFLFSASAVRLADSLDQAGFHVAVTAYPEDVPRAAPRIENVAGHGLPLPGACSPRGARVFLYLLSFTVLPVTSCETFGDEFDFRSSAESPAQHVDTRYNVTAVHGFAALSSDYASAVPPEIGSDGERSRLRTAVLNALEIPP